MKNFVFLILAVTMIGLMVPSAFGQDATIPPLQNYMRSSINGDIEYLQIYLPGDWMLPIGITMPIGIEFDESVALSGNPITISLVTDSFILESKQIYPENISERIISDIRTVHGCNDFGCSIQVSYDEYTTEVSGVSVGTDSYSWLHTDKIVYLPDDTAELFFIHPSYNISPNDVDILPVTCCWGAEFFLEETGIDTGIFHTTFSFVSQEDQACSRDARKALAENHQLCMGITMNYPVNDSFGWKWELKRGGTGAPYGFEPVVVNEENYDEAVLYKSQSKEHTHLNGISHTHEMGKKPHIHKPEIVSESKSLTSSKIPDWVKSIFTWYSQDQISEDEVLNAIKFLVNQGIINLDE